MENTKYITATKIAAYKIVLALREFESYQPTEKNQLINATMARVNKILNGEAITIEGPGLTRVVDDVVDDVVDTPATTEDLT